VALYEQFGFKVIDQEDISGVNNRFMWREAAARSGGSGGSWPALEQRAMRKCEQVFGRIPEDFPPKRIVRGIEQIQEQNTHIWPNFKNRNTDLRRWLLASGPTRGLTVSKPLPAATSTPRQSGRRDDSWHGICKGVCARFCSWPA
jgi:hypothetical protein